jgi:hypothetical protein
MPERSMHVHMVPCVRNATYACSPAYYQSRRQRVFLIGRLSTRYCGVMCRLTWHVVALLLRAFELNVPGKLQSCCCFLFLLLHAQPQAPQP